MTFLIAGIECKPQRWIWSGSVI